MPSAPLRFCSTPGCSKLVPAGRCPEHRTRHNRARYAYDNEVRGSAAHRGYGARWRRWRAYTLSAYSLVLCGDRPPGAPETQDSICRELGRVTPGRTLDHIARVTGPNDLRFYDITNVQLLCERCDQRRRGQQSHEPPTTPGDDGERYVIA